MGGVVLVEDETRVEFEAKEQRIWAPRGVYPKVEITQKKEAHCFFGVLDIFSGDHLVHDTKRMTSKETVKLLEKIRKHYQRRMRQKTRVLLLWDGAPWHRGAVREYLKGQGWLEIMYFPAYSPELNPEELVWNEAKREITKNHEEDNFDDLIYKFYRFVTEVRISPVTCQRIIGF